MKTLPCIAAQLPKKTDLIVYAAMTPLQLQAYRRLVRSALFQEAVGATDKFNFFPCLMALRQAANHLGLLNINTTPPQRVPPCPTHNAEAKT